MEITFRCLKCKGDIEIATNNISVYHREYLIIRISPCNECIEAERKTSFVKGYETAETDLRES